MKVVELGKLNDECLALVGGKAIGLDFLKKNNFNIADGFVLMDLTSIDEVKLEDVIPLFDKLNAKKVAIRSSASDEDGTSFSSAGQYETVLNVTKDNVMDAIKTCLDSLNSSRAISYQIDFMSKNSGQNRKMNIVFQKMVDSSYSGVTFSKDISDNSKILIECVKGLGENLVSGSHSAERYLISTSSYDFNYQNNELIDEKLIKEIYEDTLKIKELYKRDVDLEWGIDENKTLYFLQLRPITTTDKVTIEEFNSKNDLKNHMLTRRNIGEMLPGAVTPLSISTSVLAIDYGMRDMLRKVGSIKRVEDKPDYYCALATDGHLFIDMTALHSMTLKVMGASASATNFSVMGEYKEDCPKVEGKKANGVVRFINMCKFGKYLMSSKKAKEKLDYLVSDLKFYEKDNVHKIYEEIDSKLSYMNGALSCHYVASSFSGAMNSALHMTLEKDFEDKKEFQLFIGEILKNIEGIESADIPLSLNKLSEAILAKYSDAKSYSCDKLKDIVLNDSDENIRKYYSEFIEKHGHRSIKEAELRSKAWKNDIDSIIKNLYAIMHTEFKKEDNEKVDLEVLANKLPKKERSAFKFLAKNARQAVVDREYSKSRIIKIIDKFKDQYNLLATLMVKENYLMDEDMIYFLTHKEIKELLNGDNSLKKKALARRKLYPEQERLAFDDIYIDTPVPLKEKDILFNDKLTGVSVCNGKVYGKGRIINSIEDASKLKEGEIMICPFTDIGWSPYYSLAGALITEVGSALSHGAVVAREYSLPTVVNVKNATKYIKDGDYLYVDGAKGEVLILDEKEYKERVIEA